MVYFLGGLKATALEDDNLEFTYDGYIDYSEYDKDGYKYLIFDTEAELQEGIKDLDPKLYSIVSQDPYIVRVSLDKAKIVAQNEKYTMFLDETTTIITVGVNNTYQDVTPTEKTKDGYIAYDVKKFGTVYTTALPNENLNDSKSNLIVQYISENGKVSNRTLNTYQYSVQYEDKITGTTIRHYKIKFNIKNGFEILYEVGDFTAISTFFPEKFSRKDMFEYFLGNLMFIVDSGQINDNYVLKYNSAITWSKECANYIRDNGLGVVKEEYPTFPDYDEEGNPIPARYTITDILEKDENGNTKNVLKMKLGVDYNSKNYGEEGASPCIANPFSNSFLLSYLFTNIYKLQGAAVDSNGNVTETYQTDWREWTSKLSPTFIYMATGSTQHSKAYDIMYKTHSANDPNYFYSDINTIRVTVNNYEEISKLYPTAKIGDTIKIKLKISYFEDLSTVVTGYYSASLDAFYSSKNFNARYYIEPEEGKNYIDKETGKTYIWDGTTYVETDHGVIMGGFQARDEDGKFLYDEDGKPIQKVLTLDQAYAQNEIYGTDAESSPPVFQVAVRFELTDKGLKTTILDNSIIEGLGKDYKENGSRTQFSHASRLYKINVLPYMTSNSSSTSEGQIILPDGSGVIISFNSPKISLGYTAFAKRIYGPDKTFAFDRSQETDFNKSLMFGMYGFLDKTEKKGVLAIADKGASQTEIYANFKRQVDTSKNIAYFISLIRENETVYIGTSRTEFTKWARGRSNTDFVYIYQFLSPEEFIEPETGNIQYVTLAQKYREYLVEKYNLQEKKDTTKDNVLILNFLGAFEKRVVTLGVGHNEEYSLTTFAQAKEIIEELKEEGGINFAVGYTAWTKDAMEPEATNRVKVSKVLGNKKGLQEFKEYLDKEGINFYPEVRISSNKGYDYNFGNMKYTAKTIGGYYSQHSEFNLATGRAETTIRKVNMLSPVYYMDYISRYLPGYKKLGLTSAYVSDIGNLKIADYAKSRLIYPEQGQKYQVMVFDKLTNELDSLMLSAPFDYSFSYVDVAVDVPLETTLLGYYDYSIPFYQLVVSGLFDYAGPAVNYDSERHPNWYLLKALETGSNLQFLLSAEDTKILLNTDYTMYYNTYYLNWKNEIIKLNNIINNVGIHKSRLVSHKILADNVYEVKYANGLTLIINYTNSPYYDYKSGLSVRANWYVVVEEANE